MLTTYFTLEKDLRYMELRENQVGVSSTLK